MTSLTLFYIAAHREGGISSVTDIPALQESAPTVESDLPSITPSGEDVPTVTGTESDLPSAPAPE